jgi:NO-binding membrane sensor protein with MHYT domain
VLAANNFSYGLLTPALAYLMSCLGAFIGLRCTTRAYAYTGAARARWLVLAAVSIGATGVWVMHFIAMLGYTIPGMTIRFNIAVTIGSMLIAVAVVLAGLLIVGFGQQTTRNLLVAGLLTGVGVASMHYTGMAAMEMPASMTYTPVLFGLSVLIGIVAATAALWAALRLRGIRATLGAALIMGVAVSGMHYTGMAAMHMHMVPAGTPWPAGGATGESFLLPLIIGIGAISIIMTALLVFSPTEAEILEDRALMERINEATARLTAIPQQPPAQIAPSARWPGAAASPRTGSPGQDAGAAAPGTGGHTEQADPYGPAGPNRQYAPAGRAEYATHNENAAHNDKGAHNESAQHSQPGHNGQAGNHGADGRISHERPRRRIGRS